MNKIRPIAIYLPQFHPIPENDTWWGKGFTEWTNVTKARPLFKDHYQPHLPADLGFYDLRLPESREAQADLAKEYGIHGFCYYHYWFNGKQVLNRPFDEVVASGKPDFPFMLCWANENWTRTWDGLDKQILLEQKYTMEDHLQHIRALLPYFKDPRYIKIDDKPVFAVYRSNVIPDIKELIKLWREEAARHNIELYLCRFETSGTGSKEFFDVGFDAAIEFQPHGGMEHYFKLVKKESTLRDEVSLANLRKSIKHRLKKFINPSKSSESGNLYEYNKFIELIKENEQYENYKRFRSVTPGWDNSARKRNNFFALKGSSPDLFQKWVADTLQSVKPYSKEENLFFINAWNEWAEGNHLEPCQKWGRQYLEVLKQELEHYNKIS